MLALLCPVCKGSGKYTGDKCHGCNGRGWVQVPEDRPVLWHPLDHKHGWRPRPLAHSLGR